jgi:hypothetical protein
MIIEASHMQGGNKVIRVAIDPHPETTTTEHELHPDLVALWDGLRACEEAMANSEPLSAGFINRFREAASSAHKKVTEAIKKKTAGAETQFVQANQDELMIHIKAITEAVVYMAGLFSRMEQAYGVKKTAQQVLLPSSEAAQYYVLTP